MTSLAIAPTAENQASALLTPNLTPDAKAVMVLTERASGKGLTIALQDGRSCTIAQVGEGTPLNIAITSAAGFLALSFRPDGTFATLLPSQSKYKPADASKVLQKLVRATEILAQA